MGDQPPSTEEATPVDRDPRPGAEGPVIGGCRLGSVVGRGGMGTVYRATQLALDREVAVKVLPASGIDSAAVARFQREARSAAALDHSNCVPIYAAGEEDGVLYLVMRLIHGLDLGALVAREGPLSPARAVTLIGQVAEALDAAHAAGLVHRDVKPSNVLIEPRKDGERAYLSDFGLMRQVIDEREITRPQDWVGTIDYASPEQLEGRTVDRRTDVYSLAGVLYTALSGERPFPGESPTATARAHLTVPPPTLGSRPLDRVIARGMAKRPEERYATAGELARAAARAVTVAEREPEPTVTRPQAPFARPPIPRREPVARGNRKRGARRAPVVAGLVLALLVVAGVVLAISLRSGSSTARASGVRTEVNVNHAFAFSVPRGWRMDAIERPMGAFERTEAVAPNGSELVIIDRDPDQPLAVQPWAQSVQRDASSTPGYAGVSFLPATTSGRQAIVWEFVRTGDRPSQRVDVFQQLGSVSYAVLGEAPTMSAARRLALSVADSLTPR
jgi:serine/threonine protein kinase